MDVRLLGPLEVHLGDGPVELGPRKQRAVLAMLALEAGRTVSADRLAAGLWGDEPPPSAPKMVQLYVSHLRRVLDGDASIATRGRGYELQLPEAPSTRSASSACSRSRAAREALALWRGDALADVADEPFAAAEIRRLEELRLRAAEMAIDADLEAGRHVEVIGELDALVAAQPAARAPPRPADARPLPRRPAVGGARGLSRRARRSWWRRSASSPAPSCSACTSRSSRTTRRSTCPRRPSRSPRAPTAAARRARCWSPPPRWCSPASWRSGSSAYSSRTALSGIDEDHVGLIDPESGRITDRYSVGHSPGAVTAGGGSVWVANRLDGTVSRIERDPGRHHPRRRRPRRARVRRGLAVGGGRRLALRRAGRSRLQQSAPADPGRQRAALAGARGGRAVGDLWRRRRPPPRRARPPGSRAPDPAG